MRFSLSSALLSLFLLLIAAAFILSASWELFRYEAVHFLLNYPLTQMMIGSILLLSAIALFYIRKKSAPKATLRIRSEQSPKQLVVEVSVKTLRKSLESYFSTLFPQAKVRCDVDLLPDRINVAAFLPSLAIEEQKEKFLQIEKELPWFLSKQTGVTQPIDLSLHFE